MYPQDGDGAENNNDGCERIPSGWKRTQLRHLTSLITSGSRGWASYYSDSGPLFIRAQDINSDNLRIQSAAHVTLRQGVEGVRTRVAQYDLLITITGANVTKSAIVKDDLGEAYVSQDVGLVRPKDAAMSPFLYYWIVSPTHGRRDLEKFAYGAGKPGLSLDNLRELTVSLPPLAEQHRIVAEVERRLSVVEEMERAIEVNLKRAERLRQAILARAFAGKLVAQDPCDEPASVLLERIRAERVADASGGGKGRGKRAVRAEQGVLL